MFKFTVRHSVKTSQIDHFSDYETLRKWEVMAWSGNEAIAEVRNNFPEYKDKLLTWDM